MNPQAFFNATLLLGLPGLLFLVVAGGFSRVLAGYAGSRFGWALWLSVVFGIVGIVLGVAVLVGAGAYSRYTPPGFAHPYLGGLDYLRFVQEAKRAVTWLYGGVLLSSGVVGYVAGRAAAAGGTSTAALTAITVSVFAILTLPLADFLHACWIGRSFFISISC